MNILEKIDNWIMENEGVLTEAEIEELDEIFAQLDLSEAMTAKVGAAGAAVAGAGIAIQKWLESCMRACSGKEGDAKTKCKETCKKNKARKKAAAEAKMIRDVERQMASDRRAREMKMKAKADKKAAKK